ncbi:G protein-coupled receptor kinase interacting ArfGAP [Carabus blaptoides fortunei]
MSRAKSRNNTEICADCGTPEPSWASVNRGIFLCAECCSIHRSFGRHISQVKSLHKSHWNPSQLLMIQTLNNNGVNKIWEHCLLDNNSKLYKRKPQPKDQLHPTKAEFIRSKHQQFAFVFRPNRDDTLCTESELGKQLHSSVRTTSIEISVRLLIQGADPNYFHDEKGTTPLHVAAKANQILQAELLMVYGADPSSPDAHGTTPVEYARCAGHKELADRLVECMYEVTDRLTFYICGKKPDHHIGKHFIVPDHFSASDPMSLSKLQKLPNHLFEELVTDVYDEIDRRETEAIWLSCSEALELGTVPFLPVDPGLSTTRNQGRQKLARFSAKELNQLVCDILNDIKRRQLMPDTKFSTSQLKHVSQMSDDEPLYDSVASDDDYALLSPTAQNTPDKSDVSVRSEHTSCSKGPSPAAIDVLTKRLIQSDSTISTLRAEVRVLQSMVEKLNSENNELRTRLSQTNSEVNSVCGGLNLVGQTNGSNGLDMNTFVAQTNSLNHINNNQVSPLDNGPKVDNMHHMDMKTMRRAQRPNSMYETREGIRTPNWQLLKNQVKNEETLRPSVTQSLYNSTDTPSIEQRLKKATANVTMCIQDLWKCIQDTSVNKKDGYSLCADRIRVAVAELTTVVPQGAANDNIRLLLDSASRLQLECASLQQVAVTTDRQEHECYLQKVRLSAYDIAKATKVLLTKFLERQKIPEATATTK